MPTNKKTPSAKTEEKIKNISNISITDIAENVKGFSKKTISEVNHEIQQ